MREARVEMRMALCLFALVLLQGCQHDPRAHTFTTEKPTTDAVAGRYVLKEQTVVPGGMSALKDRPCWVDLRADGRFSAMNIPPLQSGAPPITSVESLVAGSGTWRLDSVGTIGGGFRKPRTHWGVLLETRGAYVVQSPGLIGHKPPYGLIFTIGDPDGGTVMILEKQG